MALLHQAQLTPSKLHVLQTWVPSQPWLGQLDPAGLRVLGAYRFDDPAGQVGIETHLLATEAGAVLQVPLTYRPEPLPDVPPLATLQHSVLGRRWVYDGGSDPVYARALLATIVTGGEQAELTMATDQGPERREPTTFVRGSGSPGAPVPAARFEAGQTRGTTTVLASAAIELTVLHVLDPAPVADGVPGLTGRWSGQDQMVLLALVRGA